MRSGKLCTYYAQSTGQVTHSTLGVFGATTRAPIRKSGPRYSHWRHEQHPTLEDTGVLAARANGPH
eukprot:475593-Prorocentrum_minimum.AAC.2